MQQPPSSSVHRCRVSSRGSAEDGQRSTVRTTRVTKQVSSSTRGENRTVTETTVTASDASCPRVRTVTTTRVFSTPRLRTKISDIITGVADETLTAREALLKWAQRTTERYPGVRITDFTNSWKDGLAFNAILHRNRPDLLDFRSLRTRSAKDNLEFAFSLAEKEFGITRLLDPEDVDTPEPDERSLITYISSMYDVFPDPPTHHPFADDEKNRKIEEYIELASNLLIWMRESLEMLQNKKFSNTLIEMKALLMESSKFRSDDIPKRNRDKQRLNLLHKEIQKLCRDSGQFELDKEYQIDKIERNWNRLISVQQERDQKIRDEIFRLEKLQRLAEKVNRESKQCDGKLDDIERKIKEEEKRVHRLHPMDAKYNCDQIEGDLKHIDDLLKSLKKDISVLEEKTYHQTAEMKYRIEKLAERYNSLKIMFQTELLGPLSTRSEKVDEKKNIKQKTFANEQKPVESSKAVMSLKEHFDWIEKKQKRISQTEFGSDTQSIKNNQEQMKIENKSIEQYLKKIDFCSSQKNSFKGSDHTIYCEKLEKLENAYRDLVMSLTQKLQDLETLFDFVQSSSRELKWMSDKEEIEVARDWSAKNLHLVELEHHQETLTSDLEKREIQFNAVQSRGESLLLQKHPASKCIEGYLTNMQSQWSWLLQLTLCLEVHLRYAQVYHQFFKEARECDQWMRKVEEKLNTTFSKNIISVDEGERYLKQMQQLKEDLTRYNDIIISVMQRSLDIVPLKMRRQHLSKPLKIIAICSYKRSNVAVSKDEQFMLKDNSQRVMWKVVTSTGVESTVPGVCFIIPAPNVEAVELGESLKRRYDDVLNLWNLRQRKLRQSLILATIKVVKTWDVSQFRSMDITQRESIMRALNEDAQKLLSEGSSTEPALVKLKDEMSQCNVMFNSMLQKLTEDETEKSPKSSGKNLSDTIASFQGEISGKEKFLRNKLQASITWDLDSLENFVIEHKEFEVSLRAGEDQMTQIVQSYKNTNRKTTALQSKYDTLILTWDKVWELSNIYVERLKAIEVGLLRLNEAIQVISSVEVQLASCDNLQSNIEDLHKVHDKLLSVQVDMQQQQTTIDDVQESVKKLKNLVLHIRSKQAIHTDVTKFENDVKKLISRWDNARSQIVERLRSCGASSELLRSYKTKFEKDNVWITETTVKVNNLKTVKRMTTKEIEMTVEPSMNLYSSIAERSSSLEETNVLGARYIREAKIYDLRLKHYKENLEEEHPSLDASLQKKARLVCGADIVGNELQNLNQKYAMLMDSILQYLQQLKEALSKQQRQKWEYIISKAVPVTLKTFATIIDQVPTLESTLTERIPTRQDFIDNYSFHETKHFIKSGVEVNTEVMKQSAQDSTSQQKRGMQFTSEEPNQKRWAGMTKVAESRNVRAIIPSDEIMSQNICSIKAIYNPKTGKMVTLHEAVEQKIFNFETEEFSDLRTGRRMSFENAVVKGFIDPAFYDRISTKCGIYLPGTKEELCLVDSVKKNLYDVKKGSLLNPQDSSLVTLTDAFHLGIIKKSGIKTLINMKLIKTTDLTIAEAIEKEFLDSKTGIFRDPLTNSTITLQEAIDKGFITLAPVTESESGITLAEAIDRNIVHDQSGQILDQDSGEKFTLDEAIIKGILRSDAREIVDLKNNEILSLDKALHRAILNAQSGKYFNSKTSEYCTFHEAYDQNLILKPLTLKDAYEKGVLDDQGITDPITGKKLSIIQSLSCGLLDCEAKCVVDQQSNDLLCLPEALKKGIIRPNGKFFDFQTRAELSLSSAIERGFITSVSQKMIFDIEGIKDMLLGESVSLNSALEKNIINLESETFLDNSSNERIPLEEAVSKGYIQAQIYDMLCKPIGVKDGEQELNLIQCLKKDYIDSKSGQLRDHKTKKTLYLKEAVQKGVITPEGAAMLKGLLNITVTMATVTRTITRFVNVPNESEEVVTQDIIDEVTDAFERQASNEILSPEKKRSKSSKISVDVNRINERQTVSKMSLSKDLNLPVSMPDAAKSSTKISQSFNESNKYFTGEKQNEEHREIPSSTSGIQHHQGSKLEKQSFLPVKKKSTGEIKYPSTDRGAINSENISDSMSQTKTKVLKSTFAGDMKQQFIVNEDSKIENKMSRKIPSLKKTVEKAGEIKHYSTSPQRETRVTVKESKIEGDPTVRSMQILELPPDGWYLKDAVRQNLFDPESGLFTVPGTDRLMSFEETVKMEIINSKSALVVDPNSTRTVSLDGALEMRILDSTGHYDNKQGTRFSMQQAIENNLIVLLEELDLQSDNVDTDNNHETEQFTISNQNMPVEYDKNDMTVKTYVNQEKKVSERIVGKNVNMSFNKKLISEPNSEVTIGVCKTLRSSENEVILQKIHRRVLSPKEAVKEHFIDEETADILDKSFEKIAGSRGILTFEDAVRNKLINGEFGKIADFKSGRLLSINDALNCGLIDKNTGKMLIPIGHCLSMLEIFECGLIDSVSENIIHPITGDKLTIEESIICEILNPFSQFIEPSTKTAVSIDDGINRGLISKTSGEINSSRGVLSLSEALQKNMFLKSSKDAFMGLPPLAPTFPVALQYGHIDIAKKEYIHPVTKTKMSLQNAIDNGYIMIVPVQPQQEYILLDDALNNKLIDPTNLTFKHPVTEKVTDLKEAMENGLLLIKPVRFTFEGVTPKGSERIHIQTIPIISYSERVDTPVSKVNTSVTVEEISTHRKISSPTKIRQVKTSQKCSVEEATSRNSRKVTTDNVKMIIGERHTEIKNEFDTGADVINISPDENKSAVQRSFKEEITISTRPSSLPLDHTASDYRDTPSWKSEVYHSGQYQSTTSKNAPISTCSTVPKSHISVNKVSTFSSQVKQNSSVVDTTISDAVSPSGDRELPVKGKKMSQKSKAANDLSHIKLPEKESEHYSSSFECTEKSVSSKSMTVSPIDAVKSPTVRPSYVIEKKKAETPSEQLKFQIERTTTFPEENLQTKRSVSPAKKAEYYNNDLKISAKTSESPKKSDTSNKTSLYRDD